MLQSLWRRSGVVGAAFRLAGLIAGASVLVLATSVPLGLVSHATLNRSISLGFYALGAFLVVLGLVAGNRGPFRRVDDGVPLRFDRKLRRATLDELLDAISFSAVMVVIGFVLVVIGIAIDDRYRLV